jgi:hypothetical protein
VARGSWSGRRTTARRRTERRDDTLPPAMPSKRALALAANFALAARTASPSTASPSLAEPTAPGPAAQAQPQFRPHPHIAHPREVEITDSAGTRRVRESTPCALPHWQGATDAHRELADRVVADVGRSAAPDAPGALFTRAAMAPRTLAERRATIPRLLDAMHARYRDVRANNLELSQLDRALRNLTGFAVNYDPFDSGDAARDGQLRESAIRQWFAYWWRHGEPALGDLVEIDGR